MTTQDAIQALLRDIATRLQSERYVELPSNTPKRKRDSLYKAARIRGLAWKFTLTDKSVIVSYRKNES